MVFDAEQEKLRCENCDSVMSFDEYEAKAEVEEEFIPRQQETVEKGDFKAYRVQAAEPRCLRMNILRLLYAVSVEAPD